MSAMAGGLVPAAISTPYNSSFACSFPNRRHLFPNPSIRFHVKISCTKSDDQDTTAGAMIERRNVLFGLGGLYGAAAGLGMGNMALGSPVGTDLSTCYTASPVPPCGSVTSVECCLPPNTKIIDFKPPSKHTPLRVRPAAHLVKDEYVAKYNEAVKRMRELPPEDPRNFMQQANVHCAYCDGAYRQLGFPDVTLQVHGSWLFFPFHRLYLYFHERILGKLIGDDTFALPFWNWDAPGGMRMPSIFNNPSSSLYDTLRDPNHLPPVTIDLDYSKSNPDNTPEDRLIFHNLCIMHRQMVSGAKKPSLFFGSPLRGGESDAVASAGTIETMPHNNVHAWTGTTTGCGENMGNFYSAARDPIFYCHHSNVDRMWHLWKKDPRHHEFNDSDWFESSFFFYDENADLVRVKIKDCLEPELLRYKYQDVETPWQNKRRAPILPKKRRDDAKSRKAAVVATQFPVKLESPVSVTVKRPKVSRSKEEKEEEEEVLVIQGIEVNPGIFVKFDVLVNATETDGITPAGSELAGSFVNVPHAHREGNKMTMKLALGITDLLEEIDADGEDSILVTIVPKAGGDNVSIGGVAIELIK
ncbi:hypothetical protein Cni_G27614 [Canna indica]|uniref:Tyrosinase copper-binding domain-containing protein n=1 Tax=Canna indica TaxID=4628 RepID=A0AAQ3L442_9LILI|nr:hypothetical protein Cni_G27614 [Canna indica]